MLEIVMRMRGAKLNCWVSLRYWGLEKVPGGRNPVGCGFP